MLKWRDLVASDTMQELVDNFNTNSNSSRLVDTLLSRISINGPVFNGLESIAGYSVVPLKCVPITGQPVQTNTVLDNWSLFFKNKDDLVKLNLFPVDLTSYNDGRPHFLYINSDLGYRVSNSIFGGVDEVLIFRFIINSNLTWNQLYVCAQRQGATMYNSSDEFYHVTGLDVIAPESGLKLSHKEGDVFRAGIDFTDKLSPDVYHIYQVPSQNVPIRYVTTNNKVNYSVAPVDNVITNKKLTYSEKQKHLRVVYSLLRQLKAYYFGIQDFCNRCADILHSLIVNGATMQELTIFVDSFSSYLYELIALYTKILDYNTEYSIGLSNTLVGDISTGIDKSTIFTNMHFKNLSVIDDGTVYEMRRAYHIVYGTDVGVNTKPFEVNGSSVDGIVKAFGYFIEELASAK